MKKASIIVVITLLSLNLSGIVFSDEIAKEGSGDYLGGKSGTGTVLTLGKDRFQSNFEETGVIVTAPQNSPITNATFRVLGTILSIDGKYKGSGAVLLTRPNGDQIFGIFQNEGVFGTGQLTGVIEIIGGTGECAGIEGAMEMLPRPVVKTSKEGAYQGLGAGKINWKIP